jgi:hypothetical protein
MARVTFSSKRGGQTFIIGPAIELADVEDALDARLSVSEGTEPPTSRDGFADIIAAIGTMHDGRDPIVVYCDVGKMRSPTLAGIYMMQYLGYTAQTAIDELTVEFNRVYGAWGNGRERVHAYLVAYERFVQGIAPIGRPKRLSVSRK